MTSPTPAQLDYAPQPPLHLRRRFRWFVLGLGLLLVVASGLRWGQQAWRQVTLLYWQHRCMTYTAPADQVVYAHDAASARLMVGEPECWHPFRSGHFEWWAPAPVAPAFLHERRSPAGHRRLVAIHAFVNLYRVKGYGALYGFECAVFVPSVLRAEPRRASVVNVGFQLDGLTARLFSGQPDPADASHFTVAYESDGRKGTIDFWLQDDDTVKMRVCDGPAKGL